MAKIELNYKDKDYSDTVTAVNITFINQRMAKMFGEIVGDITKLQQLHKFIEGSMDMKGEIIVNNEKKVAKEKLEEFEKELKIATDEYYRLCTSGIDRRRFELIQMILKANHVNDDRLESLDFWEEYVDPADMNEFMAACIMKDKKKV